MKTYSEAVETTMLRKGVSLDEKPLIYEEIAGEQDRFYDLVREVQESEEASVFADGLIEMRHKHPLLTLEQLLVVAFSHGVMVGIEMERP